MEVIGVLNHGFGNIRAISNILDDLGITSRAITHPGQLIKVSKLIIPGVGSFDPAMKSLQACGLVDGIRDFAKTGKIILGICLGMQLLCSSSEEGKLPGFGFFSGSLSLMKPEGNLRVPHVGWNYVEVIKNNPLLAASSTDYRFYHNHSYALVGSTEEAFATLNYGNIYSVGLMKDNFFGVQFHPEKSHKFGRKLLMNFSEL